MANNEPVLGNAANDNSEPSSRSSSGEAGRLGRGLESLIPPNHSASNTPVQHSGQVGQAEAHPASDVSGASHATSTSSGQAASQTPMHQEPAETNHDEPARLAIDNAPRELSRPSATPTAHDALPGVSAEQMAAPQRSTPMRCFILKPIRSSRTRTSRAGTSIQNH